LVGVAVELDLLSLISILWDAAVLRYLCLFSHGVRNPETLKKLEIDLTATFLFHVGTISVVDNAILL
jgi:hypothetical protein